MSTVHEKLTQRYEWYRKWHSHPQCNFYHWVLFLLLAILSNAVIVANILDINKFFAEISRPQSRPERPESRGIAVGQIQNRILVKFKEGLEPTAVSAALERSGLTEQRELKQIGVKIIGIGSGNLPETIAARLQEQELGIIEFAEPDSILEPALVPNDPWFANWQMDKQRAGFPTAWDKTSGSQEQTIAVADTGVDCAHEDLSANCVNGWNFIDNSSDATDAHGHGTRVAGVLAALGNNGFGVAGGVWNSKIMPLRISGSDGLAPVSAIAEAVVFAADNGVKVVNNSYNSGASKTVQAAARYLFNKGGLLVVSQGNSGADTGNQNSRYIVSVAATDISDNRYSWSSFGNDVDVAAPGCTGATTAVGNNYGSFCGTSNSAPEVSGLLSLIWSVNPNLSPDNAEQVLFNSAIDLGETGWDQYFGWGRIDAGKAIELANSFQSTEAIMKLKGRGRQK